MIFKFLLILIIFSTGASAFDKDFRPVNDRIPLEFQKLFDSLKAEVKTSSEKIRMVGICKELDENLGYLEKEHIYFLMKSEVIKNILEFKFKKVRQFDITLLLIQRLQEDLAKKERFLNPFSQWVWRAILAELNHRQKLGLISNKSFSPGTFEGAKLVEAQRFARYLNYLLPWIDRMDSLTAAEFNDLTKEVSWIILTRLNDRSVLFKRFASTARSSSRITIFNIPGNLLELHPEEIKRMRKDDVPLTLNEQSKKAESEALKQVQKVSPEDLSPLSDEISQELEKKAP